MTKPLPSPQELRNLLDYCPETGVMQWKPRDLNLFPTSSAARRWHTRWCGKPAMNTWDKAGYKVGSIAGVSMKAHRVAWAIHFGQWPKDDIDHMNGDKSDNRIRNLRPATRAENSRYSTSSYGSSRFKGVSRHRKTGKWRATITVNRKQFHLGLFGTQELAAIRYNAAAVEFFGVFAKLNKGVGA